MVYLFVCLVFFLSVAGLFALLRATRVPVGLRIVAAVIWLAITTFGGFGVLNEWHAAERRAAMISECERNLGTIGAAIGDYRRTHGAYPPDIDALEPLLTKHGDAKALLHCPRAKQVRDRKLGPDPCNDPPLAPEYDKAICFGQTFHGGDSGPSDYVLHVPPPGAPPAFVLVEERDFNHPQGWSAAPRWKTVLHLDGAIGVIHR